ncbi:unnamed protein product [Clonostachys solani]|uniref:Major facilitator superfamily (MFS) profile domain-containing protein n=1 Tax=Clonostachys solani TaxID=160281 RepID=A0A9N9ZEZ4_9HYPO|nr:unnamed protein product [Clonostachys solani]
MPRQNSHLSWRAVAIGLAASALMYCIYRGVLKELPESLNRVTSFSLFDNAFVLGSSIATLPTVVLYERVNHRNLLLGSVILYRAASAFCKMAPNVNALIAGRFLAGASAVSVFHGYPFLFPAINV